MPWWRSSEPADELAIRRSQLVEKVLVGLIIATVGFAGIGIAGNPSSWRVVASMYGVLLTGHLFAVFLSRKGWQRLVAAFYVLFYFAMITGVTYFLGGITQMHAAGYIIVTLLAGLTISARAGMAVALLSLGMVSVIGLVEVRYGLPPSPMVLDLWTTWTSHAANLLAAGLFIGVAIRGFEDLVRELGASERSEWEARESLERVQAENERRARQGTAIGRLGLLATAAQSPQGFIEQLDAVLDSLVGTSGLAVIERCVGENAVHTSRIDVHRVERVRACSSTRGWHDSFLGLDHVAVIPISGNSEGLCSMVVVFDGLREISEVDWLLFESTAVMLGSLFDRQHAEAQLRRAQRMEAVGRLAGAVAHDFNNLLTSITLSAALAQDASDPEEIEGCVRDVLTSAAQASQLTKRLLSFSRKDKTQAVRVDLNRVIREFLPVVRRMIGEDIVVLIELCEGEIYVLADPASLEQVVLNLAVNAREAMPDGGELWVSTSREVDDRGESAVLAMRDTGSGIPPELIERIFDPFYTTKDDGTGLGLATVHAAATAGGGRVAVLSSTGEGSTFSVHLPLIEGSNLPKAAAEPPKSTATGLKILLVDDQAMIRRTVSRILVRAGHDVVAASSGAEGIEAFGADRFDLVLTDVVMPVMKGDAMVAQLREIRPVRVVFMSGYTEQPLSLDAEQDRFIAKPFTPTELLALLGGFVS